MNEEQFSKYQRWVEQYLKNIEKESKEFWEAVELAFDDSKGDDDND